jgi:pyridoxine kinase
LFALSCLAIKKGRKPALKILAIQSHVVFGHAGNAAAEFPMRRMGANVWPLNTVQ